MALSYNHVINPVGPADNHILREMFDDVKSYTDSLGTGPFLPLAGGTISGNLAITGTLTTTGVHYIADGTVGAPGLAFSAAGNLDNGIYRIGTDNWGLSAAGTKCIDIAATGVAVRGTNTNNSAAAGFVGEYVESAIDSGSPVTLGLTNVYSDLTSISLTAGCWLVSLSGRILISNGATTWTQAWLGLGTVTGNDATGSVLGDTAMQGAWASSSSNPLYAPITISPKIYRLTGTTTIYAKIRATYSAGNAPTAIGRLSAIRVY